MTSLVRRWFSDRRTKDVLEMVRKHLELTTNAVQELYNMVCIACEKPSNKDSLYQKISDIEMEADQLRRTMVTELTTKDIFPTEREDLMELVRAVDWVADWAREAGRILVIIPFDEVPIQMKEAAQDMCKANNECVSLLAECVNVLPSDPIQALKLADEVETLEEELDDLYSIARKHLATLKFPKFTVGALILLNEFLDALETVADWCENTADLVRAVGVRIHQ